MSRQLYAAVSASETVKGKKKKEEILSPSKYSKWCHIAVAFKQV